MSAPRFGYYSTSTDVLNAYSKEAEGKYVIITGGNVGLGFECTVNLIKAVAHVVIASRSVSAGDKAIADIKKFHPHCDISFMQLDLGSFSSIRSFAMEYLASKKPLHLLVNNAGNHLLFICDHLSKVINIFP